MIPFITKKSHINNVFSIPSKNILNILYLISLIIEFSFTYFYITFFMLAWVRRIYR